MGGTAKIPAILSGAATGDGEKWRRKDGATREINTGRWGRGRFRTRGGGRQRISSRTRTMKETAQEKGGKSCCE